MLAVAAFISNNRFLPYFHTILLILLVFFKHSFFPLESPCLSKDAQAEGKKPMCFSDYVRWYSEECPSYLRSSSKSLTDPDSLAHQKLICFNECVLLAMLGSRF